MRLDSMKSKLIAYAMDCTSFIIQKSKNKERIKNIILFGSVAREEADRESDIDIFVDVTKSSEKIEKEFDRLVDAFHESTKYKNYWNMLDVKNDIKLTIGKLDEWKELKPSVVANGIVLYSKFAPEMKEGKHKTFFIWENVKPNAKRVLLNKQLFGHTQGKKFYDGLIQKFNGERLGKGCILVPLEHATVFMKLFRKHKVSVKIKKVLEYVG